MRKTLLHLAVALPLVSVSANVLANSTSGSWGRIIDMDLVPVAMANLPDGRLLTWSARDKLAFGGSQGKTYTSVFNPFSETFSTVLVNNTNHDMFCPGTNNLPDGRILVAGGSGNAKVSIYDPATGAWQNAEDMSTPRGYQGNVTMGDGTVFTLGGSWSGGIGNKNAEIWSPQTGWVAYPEITSDATVRDGSQEELQGEYRDDNHAWLWAAPNGKIFHAGPSQNMHWIDVDGSQKVVSAGRRGDDFYAMNGTSTMYDIGKVLTAGGARAYGNNTTGTRDASARAYSIDISSGTANVERTANMRRSRTLHNAVALPNGEVMVVGGLDKNRIFSDTGGRLVPEIWNPVTNTWRDAAAMAEVRSYHSAAILLGDGRVMVGGGGLCGSCSVNHPNVQIFSPPYLFSGGNLAPRPQFNSAPSQAFFNGTTDVVMDRAVSQFVLMRMASATHSVNNEQRRVPLQFSQTGTNSYRLQIPGQNIAPPGNYMLFAMTSDGVPSVSYTIRLGTAQVQPVLADGEYWVESPSSGQRLAGPSWNDFKALMVDQGVWDDQRWIISHLGNRIYTVRNKSTGRYLEIEGAACQNLSLASTATSNSGNHRRWFITRNQGGLSFRPMHCKSRGLDREQDANYANAIAFDYLPNHAPQTWNVRGTVTDAYPQANADSAETALNTAITINVLANDTGSGLNLTSVNEYSQQGGRASIQNNQIRYTPANGFSGEDVFWYVFADSQGRVNSAAVTVTVTGGGSAYPVANPDSASTVVGSPVTINVLSNDTGVSLRLSSVNAYSVEGGTVVISNNQLVYTPPPSGFTGRDSFWYVFEDNIGRTNAAPVTVDISAGNNSAYPVANEDTTNTNAGTAVTVNVLANDSGTGLRLLSVNEYSVNGGISVISNNQIVFTPRSGFSGQDSFWYVFEDNIGRTNAAKVVVNVN